MMPSRNKLKKREKRQRQFEKLELKRFSNFIMFWEYIQDRQPFFCIICGYYIPISSFIFCKLLKGKNLVHKRCTGSSITWNSLYDRLNEESDLICNFQPKLITNILLFGTRVCRKKIKNNEVTIRKHLLGHDYFLANADSVNWMKLRHEFFLKPTGIPFPKVRASI